MEHANVRYARRTPSHTLHEQKILWDVVVSLEKGSYTFILNIKSDCSWHKNHQREYFNSTSWLKFARKSDLSDIRHTVLLHFHLFSWRLTSSKHFFSDAQLQHITLWHLCRSLTFHFQKLLCTARAVQVSTCVTHSLNILELHPQTSNYTKCLRNIHTGAKKKQAEVMSSLMLCTFDSLSQYWVLGMVRS